MPLTIGTPPVSIHCLTSVLSRTVVEKNFFAVSFCASVAFDEIARYWPGLPTVSLGSPLPPSTDGKFMYPRCPPLTKFPPLPFIEPYVQVPCSIMAALPVYSRAWSALESAVMDEKPLMNPLAFTRSCTLVSMSMTAGCDQASFLPSKTAWNTSGPPMRSRRNSSHIMFVQRDCPPSENGAMPLALIFGTAAMMSLHDCGGWIPTLSSTVLL